VSERIRIGTRKSPLAMWQAEYVRDRLTEAHPGLVVELVPIETKGDKILDVALSKVGGKGLFVKELEVALLEGSVDICVHSTKDMPGDLPEGLGLVAFPPRADPRDALVMGGQGGLSSLPYGARVGTSSLRRQAQLLAVRPDLEIVSVRGNIQTRMKKVEELGLTCVVLASAGIERMAEASKIGHRFSPDEMLPAAAQGILSIEARLDDARTLALVRVLDDDGTRRAALAERGFLKTLGGGCQVPIAAYATEANGVMTLRGLVADPSGRVLVRGVREGPASEPAALGRALGEEVLATGGRRILVDVGLDVSTGGGGALTGMTAVVARDDAPDDNISLALSARGAVVVPLRLMDLAAPADGAPLEAAVRALGTFDVFAFTSAIAVERFMHAMRTAGVDLRQAKPDAVVAAVGPKTRDALLEHHIHVDVTGDAGGESLAAAIRAAVNVAGKHVLFPRAEGGREELERALVDAGATVRTVNAYRHIPLTDAAARVDTALSRTSDAKVSALVVTSPRRVHTLCDALGDALTARLAGKSVIALGQTTAAALRERGIANVHVVDEASPASVAAALSVLVSQAS
jgi:hydroxymethylbilane synthase